MRVKICGVSTIEEAKRTADLGADAIGLLAAVDVKKGGVSRGIITKEIARDIVNSLPPFVDSVLVTSYDNVEKIIETCKFVGNKTLQICWPRDFNDEWVDRIRENLPYMKIINVVNVTGKSAVQKAKKMENFSDAILLDSRIGNQLGGTGRTHNWDISRQIVQSSNVPVILAGGLNPENLKEAIKKVRPWGVDVHTGVENPDWSKNYEKIKRFIRIAKNE